MSTLSDTSPIGGGARTFELGPETAWPYPIVALLHRALATHEDAFRLAGELRLAESVVRFLALVNLADALGREPARSNVDAWAEALVAPGFGKWLWLLGSSTAFAAERGGPFVGECAGLVTSPWMGAADGVKKVRNRFAHDKLQLGADEALRLRNDIAGPLHAMLEGVRFLRHYQLGWVTGLTDDGALLRYQWYSSRGHEEFSRPIQLAGRHRIPTERAMLLHVARREALALGPCMVWTPAKRIVWLAGLSSVRGATARYVHPVDGVEDLVQPADLASVASETSRARVAAGLALGLDDASAGRLDASVAQLGASARGTESPARGEAPSERRVPGRWSIVAWVATVALAAAGVAYREHRLRARSTTADTRPVSSPSVPAVREAIDASLGPRACVVRSDYRGGSVLRPTETATERGAVLAATDRPREFDVLERGSIQRPSAPGLPRQRIFRVRERATGSEGWTFFERNEVMASCPEFWPE